MPEHNKNCLIFVEISYHEYRNICFYLNWDLLDLVQYLGYQSIKSIHEKYRLNNEAKECEKVMNSKPLKYEYDNKCGRETVLV